jgi:hypothetical protein
MNPLAIYLVNAGCRQAGPKILFDLSGEGERPVQNLRYGIFAKGRERHPVALLDMPIKRCYINMITTPERAWASGDLLQEESYKGGYPAAKSMRPRDSTSMAAG